MTCVYLLIWVVLISRINCDKFVVIYGETQTGKSTVVNAILGKNVARTGKGKGYSVTSHPSVHSRSYQKNIENGIPRDFKLHMMDTPGNLDTKLRWSDKDILNNILFAIQTAGVDQIDVIFISESLSGDAVQLTRNLDKIRELFGDRVMDSIVVLGLKPKLGNKLYDETRADSVQKLCQDAGLKYLSYESFESHNYRNQFTAFMNMIFNDDIKPYKLNEIAKIRQEIEQRAQELMEQAPIEHKIISVDVQVIKYKDVKRTEQYWDRKWGVVGKGEREHFGLFGRRERIYGWIPVQKSRTVTDKVPYEETEKRDKQVEIPKDINKFRAIAQEEWSKKMTDSLKIKVDFKTEL